MQDVLNSWHEVTVIDLEPTPNKFCEDISTFQGGSPSQSLDIKKGAADAQVVLWPKLFCYLIKNLSQRTGENLKKICEAVSDLLLI